MQSISQKVIRNSIVQWALSFVAFDILFYVFTISMTIWQNGAGLAGIGPETLGFALGLYNFPFIWVTGPFLGNPETVFGFIFQFAFYICVHGTVGGLLGIKLAGKKFSWIASFAISGAILLGLFATNLFFFTT